MLSYSAGLSDVLFKKKGRQSQMERKAEMR